MSDHTPMTECDQCGDEVHVDETHHCDQHDLTLCGGCICEQCEAEREG